MFGFRSKKADELSHWYTPVPNYSSSAKEFYAEVEKELKEQHVPGLNISYIEFSEGGVLSDKRQYLRMTRERLVFDVCAAPFGVNYFYSCRFAEIPAVVEPWQLLALACGMGFIALTSFYVFVRIFGLLAPFIWPVAFLGVVLGAIYVMRNAVAIGIKDLDKILLQTPIINGIYEAWFRRETYYRQDVRLMYLTVVEGVVKKLVEQETAAKGVKLLTQYEHAPILHGLYYPTTKRLDQKTEAES
ncbi:MAG: hypothetical protein JWR19_4097 [Pedosphaera sp.]|nr:hypothetical protein [Pedosphaera sp.]